MTRFSLFMLVLLSAMPALAQEDGALPPYCRFLPAHEPVAGVEYQPGVDVYGRPVAPADLNQSVNSVPKDIVIPAEIDLAERFSKMQDKGLEMKHSAGQLTVKADGTVLLNGQDISQPAYALCGKVYGPPQRGQEAADAVPSDSIKTPEDASVEPAQP